jgi:hypothetical protein
VYVYVYVFLLSSHIKLLSSNRIITAPFWSTIAPLIERFLLSFGSTSSHYVINVLLVYADMPIHVVDE